MRLTAAAQTESDVSAEFECNESRERERTESIGTGVFQGGFDALKRHFGSR